MVRRVLRTKQPGQSWRSAPIFASAHRGALQKSAKRKRFHWVPYTLAALYNVCEGCKLCRAHAASDLRSGTMKTSSGIIVYSCGLLWRELRLSCQVSVSLFMVAIGLV